MGGEICQKMEFNPSPYNWALENMIRCWSSCDVSAIDWTIPAKNTHGKSGFSETF